MKYRQGDPYKLKTKSQLDRFINRFKATDSCWLWMKTKFTSGYGRFKANGKDGVAHRFSYINFKGPILPGLELDHLCRNRACVNPAHLEPVTHRENEIRGNTVISANFYKTHCVNGHELKGVNVFIRSNGNRRCQRCEYDRQKIYRNTDSYRKIHAEYERKRRLIKKGAVK